MTPENKPKTITLKDAAVFIPLFATSVALCWDIGSFFVIGGSAFSYFTFSEHLVFALPALTIAIAGFFVVSVEIIVLEARHARKPKADDGQPEAKGKFFDGPKIFALVFGVAAIVTSLYNKSVLVFWCGVSALVFVPLLQFAGGVMRKNIRLTAALTCSWFLASAFLFGLEDTRRLLQDRTYLNQIETGREIKKLKALKSGDKGTLFYDPQDATFLFIAKEDIKGNQWPRTPLRDNPIFKSPMGDRR